MAVIYSEAITKLNQAAADLAQYKAQLESMKSTANNIDTNVGGMATKYGAIISAVNAAPNTGAFVELKKMSTQIVADFNSVKTTSAAMKTAVEGVLD